MDELHSPDRTKATTAPVAVLVLTNLLLIAMISTVGGIAIYLQYFYRPSVDRQYRERLAQVASARLSEHSTEIGDETIAMFRQTWPIVRTALVEEAREDYPRLAETLQQEGSTYFNNVEAAFLAKVKGRYHDYLMQHRKILTSEFPEHATRENVQRVLAAFEATFGELVERYYLDQLRHEAARTERLWQSIPPARQPESDEPELEQQLAQTAQDWLITVSRPPREVQSSMTGTVNEPGRIQR